MTNDEAPRPLYGISYNGGWLTRSDINADVTATDNPNFAYCWRDLAKAEQAARQYGGTVDTLPRGMW